MHIENIILICLVRFMVSCVAYSSKLKWRKQFPLKRRQTFNEIRGLISQEIKLF
jgi:hypothetical protein